MGIQRLSNFKLPGRAQECKHTHIRTHTHTHTHIHSLAHSQHTNQAGLVDYTRSPDHTNVHWKGGWSCFFYEVKTLRFTESPARGRERGREGVTIVPSTQFETENSTFNPICSTTLASLINLAVAVPTCMRTRTLTQTRCQSPSHLRASRDSSSTCRKKRCSEVGSTGDFRQHFVYGL